MRAAIVSARLADPERRGKLRALAGMGGTITAIVPGGRTERDGPIQVIGIPARGPIDRHEAWRWSARRVLHTFRDIRPDIIQIEAEPHSQVAAAAASAARRLRVPYVAFSWESLARERPWLARRRARAVLSQASGVLGGNALAAGLLRAAAPGAPHAVIPQWGIAVPPGAVRTARPQHLAIGFVGRLLPERGVDQLLMALNHVHGRWTLDVLGTGPEQEMLEAMAQRFGQASRIRWLGGAGREAIDALWDSIEVLVVPSRTTPAWVEQHHPLLLEAMARGIVPVVTTAGALPDLVGEAGIVADSPEAIGLGLQELLADPVRRGTLGAAGRQRVLTCYSDTAVAEQTSHFWQTIMARGRSLPA